MNFHSPELDRLTHAISRHGPSITAFSGGIDSTLVAFISAQIHGRNAIAITGVSPSLAENERMQAEKVAKQLNIRHRFVDTHEIEQSDYRANRGDRCFHCKSELFGILQNIRKREGYAAVMSGDNLDDLQDVRPGMRAAEQYRIFHPLIEAELDKSRIRSLANKLGIPNFAKPASPCLASRIPDGTLVSADVLQQVEHAESALRSIGFKIFRVRHHGELARIEVTREEFDLACAHRLQICKVLKSVGYRWVTLDLAGFRGAPLLVLSSNQNPKDRP